MEAYKNRGFEPSMLKIRARVRICPHLCLNPEHLCTDKQKYCERRIILQVSLHQGPDVL